MNTDIGFAVPVDAVNRVGVVPQLVRHSRHSRPAMGIGLDEGVSSA